MPEHYAPLYRVTRYLADRIHMRDILERMVLDGHARRRPGEYAVKRKKQHRYVSRRGPMTVASAFANDIARALAEAENEGWPSVVAPPRRGPAGRTRVRLTAAPPPR
jgi:hypothetical protein